MTVSLHPNLAKKTFVAELPLCLLLLEDERNYPWLFLVPQRENVSRMMDLSSLDQLQLIKELDFVQKILWEEFQPHQLNVAAIGNKTPQLHIHVIARYTNDPAWPGTVWDHPVRTPFTEREKQERVQKLQAALSLYKNF